MSDNKPDNAETSPETPETVPDPARRRLTGAALGAGAVFTLSSQPVWASRCTISGMMSGNLSKPKEKCDGCTPGYWKQCQHLDSWIPTGFKPWDAFNTVFGVSQYVDATGKPYTLLDVMGGVSGSMDKGGKDKNKMCSALPAGYLDNPMGRDPISTNLGFHAVAALLNAAHPNVNFGYTSGDIINLFRSNYLTKPAALKDSFEMLNERGCPLN